MFRPTRPSGGGRGSGDGVAMRRLLRTQGVRGRRGGGGGGSVGGAAREAGDAGSAAAVPQPCFACGGDARCARPRACVRRPWRGDLSRKRSLNPYLARQMSDLWVLMDLCSSTGLRASLPTKSLRGPERAEQEHTQGLPRFKPPLRCKTLLLLVWLYYGC